MNKNKILTIFLFLVTIAASNVAAQRVTGHEKIDRNSQGELTNFQDFDDYVDLSTGKIHPSINLLNLEGIKLNTNISITYDSGSNKVNSFGGVLGQDWSLNAGGYIMREVRGIPDDAKAFNPIPSDIPEFITLQGLFDMGLHHMGVQGKRLQKGYLDYHVKNCISDLCSYTKLYGDDNENYTYAQVIDDFFVKPIIEHTYPIGNMTASEWCRINGELCISNSWDFYFAGLFNWGQYSANNIVDFDREPDVFYYNLGNGITGKFVFDSDSRPVSIPENDVKIEPAIGMHGGDSWIFTTLDGTKYYFENTNDYREESWEYFDSHPWVDNDGTGGYPTFVDESKVINRYVSKWYMSKIVHQSGEEILFEYRDQPDLEYTLPNPIQLDYHPGNRWGTISEWGTSKLYNRTDRFIQKERKSIDKITSENGEVTFNYSSPGQSISNLQHLFSITYNNSSDDEVKRFNLAYEGVLSQCNTTSWNDYRFYLKSLQEISNGQSKPLHEFKYNRSEKLPCLGSSKQDYWGYYNRNTTSNLIPPATSLVGFKPHELNGADRSPDLARSKAGILEEIHSPLGGISVFEYELNDFYEWNTNVSIGGGLRVASITNYTSPLRNNGTKTKFTYRLANDPSKSSATKKDVGRNHDMYYYFSNYGSIENPDPRWKIYTSRTKNSRYHKYLSEPVRYSNVIVEEVGVSGNANNGKTIYYLTDFNTNPDVEPLRYVADRNDPDEGFKLTTWSFTSINPAAPKTSKDFERGIITKIETYNGSGTILQEETFDYSFKSLGDPIYGYRISNPYEIYWKETFYESPQGSIEIYHHTPGIYSMDKRTIKSYDLASSNPVITSDDYVYHSEYPTLIKLKSSFLSDGDTRKENFKYAFDFPNNLIMRNMTNYHIISNPIEMVTEIDDKVVDAEVYKYDCFNCVFQQANGGVLGILSDGVFAIEEMFKLEIAAPISDYNYATNSLSLDPRFTRLEVFEDYDDRGNPLETSRVNGLTTTYIWGYDKKYPIAKIENATRQDADDWLDSNYDKHLSYLEFLSDQDIDDTSEDTLRLWLNRLRTGAINEGFDEVMITTYTHDPSIGMTSMTDPRGYTTYYEYDALNRLEFIRDENGKVYSKNEYNYKN